MPRPSAKPGPETRAILAELIELWDKRGATAFEFKPDLLHISNGLMIFPLVNHTARLSKGVLIGVQAGLDAELVPLVRLSMECALTAAWLAVTQKGGEALTHEGARQRRAALEGMQVFGYETEAELEEARDVLDRLEASAEGKHFEQRCESLVGGKGLYLTYRAASAYSHAGMALSDHYLAPVPKSADAPLGLAMHSNAKLPTIEEWIGVQAAMLLLAQAACDRARAKPRYKTQLQKYAKRLGSDIDIRLVSEEAAEAV